MRLRRMRTVMRVRSGKWNDMKVDFNGELYKSGVGCGVGWNEVS